MKVGFSLSPGGLLLPYHLGALDSLRNSGVINVDTAIAGSSAGAIAAVSLGCELDTGIIMDATVDISQRCLKMGGARGRLLPLLKEKLEYLVDEERYATFCARNGTVGVVYREIFPQDRPMFCTEFEDRDDLIRSVCHSSTFPFFSTFWPAALDTSKRIPRLVVDGFFAVPRNRFGCPDLAMAGMNVNRTVAISVFPRELIGLDVPSGDCISPRMGEAQFGRLIRLATEPSTESEMKAIYQSGWSDAERWLDNQI